MWNMKLFPTYYASPFSSVKNTAVNTADKKQEQIQCTSIQDDYEEVYQIRKKALL
jgi:hypothetical protein